MSGDVLDRCRCAPNSWANICPVHGDDRHRAVLDLDAEAPTRITKTMKGGPIVSVRMPPSLAAYVREQAYIEHTNMNAYIVRLIRRDRDGDRLPADVRDWLTMQAAQCGCPGDIERALLVVLRHLADRWPTGARLNP